MCGIAGYIGRSQISENKIIRTLSTLNHRGPDGEGIHKSLNPNLNILLLHKRLAIIDTKSRSDQPFYFNKTYLAFNGEIYNYLEIKKELISLGHQFITTSDTEVLSHALFEWKENAIKKLEGMWSFAWHNVNDNTIILSRDFFGEKPLYYLKENTDFYFASEIKAIASLKGSWPELNYQQLLRYNINGYKSLYKSSETFYKNVKELKPGSFIKFQNNINFKITSLWNNDNTIDNNISYNEIVEHTRYLLINNLEKTLRSDVPLAFCMSGGVDSNSLISIAKRKLNYNVHGFTIMNEDSRYNEEELVSYSAKELEIMHTPVHLSNKNFLKNLSDAISSHDGPLATISYYVHRELLREISSQNYKVSISGTGADELFTGYIDHNLFYLYEIQNEKKLFKESLENWHNHTGKIVRNPFLKDVNIFINDPSFRKHIYLNSDVFSELLIDSWNEDFYEEKYSNNILRNRMKNELFNEVVPVVLHEDDLNSMSFSVENRSPFLNKNLYNFLQSIPSKYLVRDGYTKVILRDAMRNIVPDKILDNRTKVGFNASIEELLDLNDKKVMEFLLDESRIYEYFQKDKIEKLIKKRNFTNSFSKFVFSFINTKLFIENNEQKNEIL